MSHKVTISRLRDLQLHIRQTREDYHDIIENMNSILKRSLRDVEREFHHFT